ncbi:hypothetical protein G7054_g15145 [Neopestalotiopsis clavispora]|nr:hypothetical protein G7054_g15145 [Neopestalotiopsis clavispora]
MQLLRNVYSRYFRADTREPDDHVDMGAQDTKFQLGTVVVRNSRNRNSSIHPLHVQWMNEYLDKIRKEPGQRRLLVLMSKCLEREPIPLENRKEMEWDWQKFHVWHGWSAYINTPWDD